MKIDEDTSVSIGAGLIGLIAAQCFIVFLLFFIPGVSFENILRAYRLKSGTTCTKTSDLGQRTATCVLDMEELQLVKSIKCKNEIKGFVCYIEVKEEFDKTEELGTLFQ